MPKALALHNSSRSIYEPDFVHFPLARIMKKSRLYILSFGNIKEMSQIAADIWEKKKNIKLYKIR